ncbi:response regulator [Halalkalibacterium halodurans]|uniref:hypothetical protein n=1 Tax=Halalkalibacterium halodurans TaxID=86665 RepID=UPI002AAA4A00|nr:hypothetical protein [Halalkalibacterium halodurans]MDY7221498.1 hypothetical protein [Halalkalibacterium halodurans]MDY7240774.1 hypothetical protein [Halalkalibacterium halodurans]
MHSVILIDHEERIRHELLEPVDWIRQSFEIVGEARKGRGMHLHAQYNEDSEVVIVKMGVAYYPEHWE